MGISKKLALAAVTGIVAGLGCSDNPPPQVPGAPATDPAGVPAARAAEPKTGGGGDKMSCSGNMSCSGMTSEPPAPQGHQHGTPQR